MTHYWRLLIYLCAVCSMAMAQSPRIEDRVDWAKHLAQYDLTWDSVPKEIKQNAGLEPEYRFLLDELEPQKDRIQVFLLGGQSNMVGNPGKNHLLPSDVPNPNPDVLFNMGVTKTPNLGTPWNVLMKFDGSQLTPDGKRFGPEMTFGRDLATALNSPTNQVALIKFAVGGTGFRDKYINTSYGEEVVGNKRNVTWHGGGDSSPNGDGAAYLKFQEKVNDAISQLKADYPDRIISIDGMIWFQGEEECERTGEADDYQEDLSAMIADVRATYGENLPFVIGQLHDKQIQYVYAPKREIVQAVQANIAESDPYTAVMKTNDLDLEQTHGIHYSGPDLLKIGSGFAAKMLNLIAEINGSQPE